MSEHRRIPDWKWLSDILDGFDRTFTMHHAYEIHELLKKGIGDE